MGKLRGRGRGRSRILGGGEGGNGDRDGDMFQDSGCTMEWSHIIER